MINKNSDLYKVAIHESGHLVVRYLLFGDVENIECVTLVPYGTALGRNIENGEKKQKEIYNAFENDEDFFDDASFAIKETCYALAGAVAEKVFFKMDSIPWEGASNDLYSWDILVGMYYNNEEMDKFFNSSVPLTESLIENNSDLIENVADALVSAPGLQMDNAALVSLLQKLKEAGTSPE